jgi:hypothetical protein
LNIDRLELEGWQRGREGGKEGVIHTYLFDGWRLLADVFLEKAHALQAAGVVGFGTGMV